MKKIINSLRFRNDNNLQLSIDNWNKQNNNLLTESIEKGLVIEVKKGLFMSKENLHKKKEYLDSMYGLIDLNIINLNNLHDEIKFTSRIKGNDIRYKVNELPNPNTSVVNYSIMAFNGICPAIMEQPLYLLEALEKYPDKLPEHEVTYYRYKYLDGKFSKPTTILKKFTNLINNDFLTGLLTEKKKEDIIYIFRFTELFINELQLFHSSTFKYFESPLFKTFFAEILKLKGYFIDVFKYNNFPSILEIEKMLTNKELYTESPKINIKSIEYWYQDAINVFKVKGNVTELIKNAKTKKQEVIRWEEYENGNGEGWIMIEPKNLADKKKFLEIQQDFSVLLSINSLFEELSKLETTRNKLSDWQKIEQEINELKNKIRPDTLKHFSIEFIAVANTHDKTERTFINYLKNDNPKRLARKLKKEFISDLQGKRNNKNTALFVFTLIKADCINTGGLSHTGLHQTIKKYIGTDIGNTQNFGKHIDYKWDLVSSYTEKQMEDYKTRISSCIN